MKRFSLRILLLVALLFAIVSAYAGYMWRSSANSADLMVRAERHVHRVTTDMSDEQVLAALNLDDLPRVAVPTGIEHVVTRFSFLVSNQHLEIIRGHDGRITILMIAPIRETGEGWCYHFFDDPTENDAPTARAP